MRSFRNLGFVLAASMMMLGGLDTAKAQNNTLTVSSGATINLTAQVGSTSTQPVFVSVGTTSSSPVQFSYGVSSGSNVSWLIVQTSGGTPSNQTTPDILGVSANPSGLAAGPYTGSIVLTETGIPNNPLVITVNLTVVGAGTTGIVATPNTLNFTASTGSVAPAPQPVVIGTTGSAVSFNVSATSMNNWLQFTPTTTGTTGTSSATVTVSVNPSVVAPSATPYMGTITITPTTPGVGAITVPVTLTVSGNPTLNLQSTDTFQFYYQIGSSAPPVQHITASSTGAPIDFSASFTPDQGVNWLVISPLGSNPTPGTLALSVASSVAAMSAGTYTGTITISAPGAANPVVTYKTSLLVTTLPVLTVSGPLAPFVYQTGTTPPANQTVQIGTTSGQSVPYTASISFAPGENWLTIGPISGAATPANLTLSLNQAGLAGLAPGNYLANVSISSPNAGNVYVFKVFLGVSAGTMLSATPGALTFNYQTTQALPAAQTLSIASTSAVLQYTDAANPNACGGSTTWLTLNQTSGTTPGSLGVSVNPTGIAAPQSCTGAVSVAAPGSGNSLSIPVTFNISATPLLNVTPLALSFTVPSGTAPSASQSVAFTATDNSAGLAFTAITNTSWIVFSPNTAATPYNLPVRVDPTGLTPGNYSGTITVTSTTGLPAGQSVTIAVSLTVTSNVTVNVTPAALT
ncbi:MAG: hypothetical protein ABI165_05710, partial [Bryobacteraceae bacterium]